MNATTLPDPFDSSSEGGKRILIIEDDPIIARIYQNRLSKEGFRVSVATEGQDGFFSIVQGKPDGVLLDLMLPNMDGVQILKKTRAQKQFERIPIIVFSNAHMNGMLQDAADAGASLVFSKSEKGALDNIIKGFKQLLTMRRPGLSGEGVSGAPAVVPEPAPILAMSPEPGAVEMAVVASTSVALPMPVVADTNSGPVLGASPTAVRESKKVGGSRFGVIPKGRRVEKPSEVARPAVVPSRANVPVAVTVTANARIVESKVAQPKLANDGMPDDELGERDLLGMFFDGGATTMAGIRNTMRAFSKEPTTPAGRAQLHGFYRQVHSLAGVAGIASQQSIGSFCECLEALLLELLQKPQSFLPSSLRTLAMAVDVLGDIFKQNGRYESIDVQEAPVLVVDDDLISQRVASLSLKKAGLKTFGAADGRMALEELERNACELIVLDVNLPDTDGFALCGHIREIPGYETTPIVFVTGLNDLHSRAKSSMSGGNDFISKPVSPREMTMKALSYVLKGRMRANENAEVEAV